MKIGGNSKPTDWRRFTDLVDTIGYVIDGASITCLLVTHDHHGVGHAVMAVAMLRAMVTGLRSRPAKRLSRLLQQACTVMDGAAIALVLVAPLAVAAALGVGLVGLLIRLWAETVRE